MPEQLDLIFKRVGPDGACPPEWRRAVLDADGNVVNVIELDPAADWKPPVGTTVVAHAVASPGDTLKGGVLTKAVPVIFPPAPAEPTIADLSAKIDALTAALVPPLP